MVHNRRKLQTPIPSSQVLGYIFEERVHVLHTVNLWFIKTGFLWFLGDGFRGFGTTLSRSVVPIFFFFLSQLSLILRYKCFHIQFYFDISMLDLSQNLTFLFLMMEKHTIIKIHQSIDLLQAVFLLLSDIVLELDWLFRVVTLQPLIPLDPLTLKFHLHVKRTHGQNRIFFCWYLFDHPCL